MKNDLGKKANRIAGAIVELVERTDGPVTLCEVGRVVPGFAKREPPCWDCFSELAGVHHVYWDGMTKAGTKALHEVMFGHRVAIQFVNELPYLLEGETIGDKDWCPIMLLPARAANLHTPKGLLRLPQFFLASASFKPSWRPLAPSPVSVTADIFSPWN